MPERKFKFYGRRRAIEQRAFDETKRCIMRTLSCGHVVAEPDGGQAANASFAICSQCKDEGTGARPLGVVRGL